LWTPETLAAEILLRLDHAGAAAPYEVAFDPTNSVAFLTKPGPFVDLVSAAIAAETGRTPMLSTTGGTSDARFIKSYCPVVEFGVVGQTMHQIDERVAVADITALTAIYERIIDAFFASGLS
jgi:succinyl-diaminopimelate desuccinylase